MRPNLRTVSQTSSSFTNPARRGYERQSKTSSINMRQRISAFIKT
jgi:hypothetical protein